MRAIMVDDEPVALEVLETALSAYKEICIIASYTDPIAALEEINTTKPDVIFLDIEMGSINGIETSYNFIEKGEEMEIVFVTGYSKYAIEAFEANALDYLLKPIQQNRLDKTIKRLRYGFNNKVAVNDKDNVLQINCFGDFDARDRENKPLFWRTKKSKELFIFLLVHHKASKDMILETIFTEKNIKNASTLLHTTIYQLRKNLGKIGFNDSIIYLNGEYMLNTPMDCDYYNIKELLKLKKHNEQEIKAILNLYKGDFLEYEGYEWSLSIQQEYKEMILDALLNFSRIQLEEKIYSTELKNALKLLHKLNPYDENIAKLIIIYLGELGHIGKLKESFKKYKDELLMDLNIKPSASIVMLYKKYSRLNQ